MGGDTPAKGNVISGNGTEGVRIEGAAATGNAMLGNRIYGNGALGIDLNGDGVTPNDPLDADGGPNNRLNFPVISAVSVLGASLVVSFSLDVPAGSYRVEFFRNPSGVDVPNGEGEVFAGFKNVTHGGGGSRSFSATITGVSGDRITATTTLCTDGGVCAAFSDTSEFSANLIATPTNYRSIGTAPDDSTGSVNTTNASQVVAGVGTSWRDDQPGPRRRDQHLRPGVSDLHHLDELRGPRRRVQQPAHAHDPVRRFHRQPWLHDPPPVHDARGLGGCIDGQGGSPSPAAPASTSRRRPPASSPTTAARWGSPTRTAVVHGLAADFTSTARRPTPATRSRSPPTGSTATTACGTGVVINTGAANRYHLPGRLRDRGVDRDHERAEPAGTGSGCSLISGGTASLQVVLRNNSVHNVRGLDARLGGIGLYEADGRVDVYNNIIYGTGVRLGSTRTSCRPGEPLTDPEQHDLRQHLRGASATTAGACSPARPVICATTSPRGGADSALRLRPRGSGSISRAATTSSETRRAGAHNPAGGRSRRPWLVPS